MTTKPFSPSNIYLAKRRVEIWYNSSLQLFSVTIDGGNTWYTMADRDVGASTAKGQGNLFQFGNNYGFPSTGTVTTTGTQVNVSSYSPSNPYSSSTYIRRSSGSWWSSSSASYGKNLWGGESGVLTDSQGPCAPGFHVPLYSEISALISVTGSDTDFWDVLGFGGTFNYRTNLGSASTTNSTYYWWCNKAYSNTNAYTLCRRYLLSHLSYETSNYSVSYGYSIRPFKDVSVTPDPDNGWAMIYESKDMKNITKAYMGTTLIWSA